MNSGLRKREVYTYIIQQKCLQSLPRRLLPMKKTFQKLIYIEGIPADEGSLKQRIQILWLIEEWRWIIGYHRLRHGLGIPKTTSQMLQNSTGVVLSIESLQYYIIEHPYLLLIAHRYRVRCYIYGKMVAYTRDTSITPCSFQLTRPSSSTHARVVKCDASLTLSLSSKLDVHIMAYLISPSSMVLLFHLLLKCFDHTIAPQFDQRLRLRGGISGNIEMQIGFFKMVELVPGTDSILNKTAQTTIDIVIKCIRILY